MNARRAVVLVVGVVVIAILLLRVAGSLVHRAARGGGEDAVLVLDTPALLEESEPPARAFPFVDTRLYRRPTVWDIVHGLDLAGADVHVRGLVLHVDDFDWGWAKVAEVRDAVQRFRATGKPVWASLEGGGAREYLLASAAGRVSMPPTSTLQIDGLSVSVLFFRGAFDKFGISPNFVHVGRYKSAVETYTRTGFSPDARAAMDALLDDLHGMLVDSVAAARRLPRDSAMALVDDGPWDAPEARARGMLDTLLYASDLDSVAVRTCGHDCGLASFARYLEDQDEEHVGTHVALVTASGTIVPGRSRDVPGSGAVLGAETLVHALREARTRSAIKAIVLRVDSPGGDAQASDDIWREVERCQAVKPVIVSMSDYAASGGYYMSVPADSIVSQPATLTGSIGIFGGKLNVMGLLHKLGLNVEQVTRGRHAGMLSPYRDFTPDEYARYQQSLERFYRGFVARVARGRHLETAAVDSVAQGRVWSGAAAAPRGLVDALGGYPRAFEMARARAHIAADEPLVVERLPRVPRTWWGRLFEGLASDDDPSASAPLPPVIAAWIAAAQFPAGAPLALLPWSIEVR